jgi:endonuclease YncB( thermonuclease family)
MAWHFTKFSSDENYANAQKSAQTKKLGIWSKSVVISPWEFRKSRKK